jgi:hypothetical protein
MITKQNDLDPLPIRNMHVHGRLLRTQRASLGAHESPSIEVQCAALWARAVALLAHGLATSPTPQALPLFVL